MIANQLARSRQWLLVNNQRWVCIWCFNLLIEYAIYEISIPQGGAPQVISWFIIPLTVDISTISPIVIRVINQLSYLGGTTLHDPQLTHVTLQ